MANELLLSVTALFSKGAKKASFNKGSFQNDVAGGDYILNTQAVGSSEEALIKGDITTPGWFIGRNNDSTDSIHIRAATGGANMVTIPPLSTVMFKFVSTATAPFVISSANTPELEYLLIEA